MPEPEIVDASSQPFLTGTQNQSYKGLLIRQSQKIWKKPPLFQTQNEGSNHQPKFRTTIWVNGESYISPNTFQQLKLSESEASKITLSAILQKIKNEALQLVHNDKVFSKLILNEFAGRMNIPRPTYDTIKVGSLVLPLFRSTLEFNGGSYTGDECRTKKEAEKSAARATILKYLDSESGNIMSEIIKSKFSLLTVTKEIQTVQKDTNSIEAKGDEGTKEQNTLFSATNNAPVMTPPTNPPATPVPQTTALALSIQTPTETIVVPTVEEQTPIISAPISLPPSIDHVASVPITQSLLNVVQPINSEIVTPLRSGKKRNRKNKKNAQKKMRLENDQLGLGLAAANMYPGQVPGQEVETVLCL